MGSILGCWWASFCYVGFDVVCVWLLFLGFIWSRFDFYVACSLCLFIAYAASILASMRVRCGFYLCSVFGFNLVSIRVLILF